MKARYNDGAGHSLMLYGKPGEVLEVLRGMQRRCKCHEATPDTILQEKINREIAYWDGIIAAEFAKLAAKGPFVIETTPEDGE